MLKRPARVVLAIEAIVGAILIGGPAGALESPVALPQAPVAPSLPLPQLPPVPSLPSLPAVSALPSTTSLPRLPDIPRLQPVPTAAADSGVARAAEPGGSVSSSAPEHVASGPSPNNPGFTALTRPRTDTASAGSRESRTTGDRRAPRLSRAPATSERERAKRQAAVERRLRQTVVSLSGCLSSLPSFEATVLGLRAGLGTGKPLSAPQVAGRLGVSAGGVRNAERSGLRGLRQANRRGGCARAGQPPSNVFALGRGQESGFARLPSGLGSVGSSSPQPAGVGAKAHVMMKAHGAPHARAKTELGRPGDSARALGHGATDSPLRWVLVLLGLVGLGLLLVAFRHRVPGGWMARAERGRARRTVAAIDLYCSFCQSRRIAINPSQGIYRCAQCGFRGTLPPAFLTEVGTMNKDDAAERAGRTRRRT